MPRDGNIPFTMRRKYSVLSETESCILLHFQLVRDNNISGHCLVKLNPLMRSLVYSSKLQYLSLRCLASANPLVFKPGDMLRQARVFTEEDILQYSKVTHDCNPLHTDATAARGVGFEGPLLKLSDVGLAFSRNMRKNGWEGEFDERMVNGVEEGLLALLMLKQLEESTSLVAVGQMGRTVIIYRPSLSRRKAEEKKKKQDWKPKF
ncbi:hypothetical protein RIF29_09828 [Crotalaria pallida]|uniref:MaoC-like domain-containing protein n=1 Tax=Crotalaria pallida TaxID=3830 RepID=A0AAN9ILP1_CROPI